MDKPSFDSPSVQSYLSFLQSVIGRMAASSSSCKTWCIAIVSLIMIFVADKTEPSYVWIAAIPVILFFALDSYYLALEHLFRDQYNAFIRKLQLNSAAIEDVFIVNPAPEPLKFLGTVIRAATSVSVYPFYFVLLAMVEVARRLIL